MDAIEQLKQDLRDGRIDVDHFIGVLVRLQRQLDAAQQQLNAANQQLDAAKHRIEELEKNAPSTTAPSTAKIDKPFSMRAEEKRQQARHKKKKHKLSKKSRRGRLTSADKLKLAERTEQCFPAGLLASDCQLSHTRPVWRLENGRAVLIA